ncbi:hypothetical protein G6O67_000721 [Ophiocordyceps sinensis]|uniref:Uncharacterized protein n=2 Tax=Ophiocordyceps sinensis TaxID=72228 RepID=A0A8H4PZT8_9HYPO|nr:hypothetical protein OCS_05238 [Ophiocordyceps sinensis CO18]KAF4513451.1 hypothetical protein G6O67_000721 [Ophiocordyceps sinensis]
MIQFSPTCSFPTTSPSGFVNSPDIRSTMDIVWSCTSIIILSTWSVLHLTVPPELKPQSKLQQLRKQAYLLGRKLVWMAIMLAFPEYLVGISTTNLFACWVNTPCLEELARDDGVPWSLTHTILANIGGIVLRFSDPGEPGELCRAQSGPNGSLRRPKPEPDMEGYEFATPSMDSRIGLTPWSQSQLGESSTPPSEFLLDFQRSQENHLRGLGDIPWRPFGPHLALATGARTDTCAVLGSDDDYKARHIAPLQGNIWVLDSKQLALARTHGIIARLPRLEADEINDRNKSDGLVRLLALAQVLWLAVQLVVRRMGNIPFSALEISTLAFSSCAFIIYLSEWSKPKDVGAPFYMDADALVSPDAFARIAEAAPISFLQGRRYYIPQSVLHQVVEGKYQKKHIDRVMIFTSILSIMLFGGLHLIAWNLEFPSRVEKVFWRASALTMAIAPTVSALLVLLESVCVHRTDRCARWTVTALGPLLLSARVFIIVESYWSLYFLPPEAFYSTWARNAPRA